MSFLFAGLTAGAGVNMNLHMYKYQHGYYAFPELRTNNLTANSAETGYFAWGPTSSMTNGIHYELRQNNITSGSSSVYNTWELFETAIGGDWTLLVTNATSTNQYTFTVDTSSISSNDFPELEITFPADSAVGVEPEPLFTWAGPVDWEGSLEVFARTDSGFFRFANLPTSETSWSSPDALNNGTNFFRVAYVTNATPLIPISVPIDPSDNALAGWASSAEIEGFRQHTFSVGSPATSGGHTLVAHYTFDDDTIYAEDISGNGNDINSSSGFGCGSLETTEEAIAGDFAANFYTEDGDCAVWLNPPTNLVSTLAGSFTVSLWIKTSAIFGEDDDSVFSAAGIVSALGGNINKAVVPMGITGSKLAFYTGGDGGDQDTLYSETSITTGDYVHLVVTRNQSTGEKKIYIDGTLDVSTIGSTALLNGSSVLDIGYNNGNGFDGDMDDIQIYSGVLSESEVTFLFNNPGSRVPNVVVGGHQNLAHYAFDNLDRLGQDNSGRENHIDCSGSWGDMNHHFNNGGVSGGGELQFYGDSYLCINSDTQTYTNWATALGGSFTFSVWVNTTNSKGNEFNNAFFGAAIFWAYNDEGTNYAIPISLTDGKVAFTTHADSSETLHSLSRVNDGTYHHLAVTRNGFTGEKKIYIDGELEATAIGTTEPLNGSDFYSIGGDSYWIDDSGTNFASYIGLLDDAQVYSGVLSPVEIATLYNNPGTTIPDTDQDGDPLGIAVDAPQFSWTTGGNAEWFPQTDETHDGTDAAQSGEIDLDEETWLRTSVTGPGTINFWWKLNSQFCDAQAFFRVDDLSETSLFCDSDWTFESIEIPPGTHTLEWNYGKYLLQSPLPAAAGQIAPQALWVDEFSFTDEVSPHITLEPEDVQVEVGSNLVLTVELYGNPTPSIQWFRDNLPLSFGTNSTLVITNAQLADSGFYYMTASNYLGEVSSDTVFAQVYLPTDLRPLSITAPSNGRGRIIVSWTGTNTGPGSVSNVLYRVALATNGTIVSTLGTGTLGNTVIPPQGSYSRSNDYRIPALPSGAYELLVEVDYFNGVIETNENNNTLSVPFTLPDVDIQLGNLQAPSVSLANQRIDVTWNTTNNGPGFIHGGDRLWDVEFFLSTDAIWDENDLNFDSWGMDPSDLAAGEYFSMEASTFLPHVAGGNYYLILFADFDYDLYDGVEFAPGILFESNETNNQIAIPIQITTPDLTPVRLLAPAGASPRQPIQIEWSIQNIGDALAQTANTSAIVKWSDRLYLSTNGLIHSGVVQLGTFSGSFYAAQNYPWPTPLPAGETITNIQTIHIPNVAERDYFIVISNNYTSSIREFVRTNNTRAIPIRVGYPDLVVTNITAPLSADSQALIPVIWEVNNQGFGTAVPNWRDRVYLSTNNTYQTNDIFLGEFLQTQMLPSGSNYFATNFVTIPSVQPGNYFVIVRTDTSTNLLESVTNNNFMATAINLASPDFAVTQFNTLTNLASQQAINVTFVVTNIGSATALPSWSDRLYFSTNAVLDASDTALGRISGGSINFTINTPLPVSGVYTQEVDVRIPAVGVGNYYLLAVADGANGYGEINEANNVFAVTIHVENPDLISTNFIAPTSVVITQRNQRIEVGWNILNQGAGAAYVNWSDYLYISPTNVFDTNAVFIGSENPPLPLNPGESYLAFDDPTLPNGIQGSYFLILNADGPNNLFESSETNNRVVSPLQIIIPPLADLTLNEVTGPAEAWSGQEIEITWILTNAGTATVTKQFNEQLFLATAADGSGATHFATFAFTGTLAPGEAVERKQRITLPISMSGLRWPFVITDSGNEIFEFDKEDNNSLVALQPININLSPFPNLTVTNILAPTNVFSGQQTVVSWAVTNQGTGPTSSPYWYDSVYLSTDTVVGNDTHLANVANVSYLNPGESYVSSATVTIPRGIQGTYYFIIRTDTGNYVFESTFDNDNVSVSPSFFIDLTPPPDLRVETVIPPLNAFSGTSIFVTWAVTNHGPGQTLVGGWFDRVYLSADTNFNGGDIPLRSVAYAGGALEAGQGYRVTNIVSIPIALTGDWYVIVLTDSSGQVFEVPFENNNDLAASTVTSIALTPPPDLETTILSAPEIATASRIFSVRYRVVNNGATTPPNGSWNDRLFISTNPVPTAPGALQLRVQRHDNQNYYGLTNYFGAPYLSHMAPGASYTNTLSAMLPNTVAGTYYVFVTSDSDEAVFELDHTNNTATASNTVEITSQPADLVVSALQSPVTAEAGNAMLISWAVTNVGVGDSAVSQWSDRLILSADDFLGDGDDIVLKNRSQESLLSVASEYLVNNEVVSIPITVSPGEYRLFLRADQNNNVYESSETNNIFGPVNIVITRDTADLQITNIIAPLSGLSGSSFSVQWIVQNFGTRPPNHTWVDGAYLSPDPVLSPSDLFLGRRGKVKQLAPGETYTNGLSATLPQNLEGDFYVIIVTDEFNQVVEAGLDGNNIAVSASAIPITLSPVPDLAVTVNAPAEAFSGQILDLSWTVVNMGTAPASKTWYEAAYLSLDHFLDPYTDIYLGYTSHSEIFTNSLEPGESYTVTNSFEVPQGLAGPYYVFVSTDTSGHVFERDNENNNIAFDPEAMLIQLTPPVDLVAGLITIPANAAPGVNASITYVVSNFGSNTARGSWEDALYISSDTNFDSGDSLFGRVRQRGDLLPNASYTNSLTAPIPGVLPGDYHVIVRSDIRNHMPESNETNNLGATLDSVAIDAEVLVLGTPDTGEIDQGQSVFYKFHAEGGTTVRIRFNTGVALSGNEIFVRYNQMPSRGQFDFAINEPFIADPDIFMPIENTGTHYLLVYSSAMSLPDPAPYTILAEVLPFTVATIFPNVAGDRGETTFKIKGALFDGETVFQIEQSTNTIPAARFMLEDSSTAYVTFNLIGAPNGVWNLKAFMNSTSIVSSTLSNAVTVTSGAGGITSFAIDGPLSVWRLFTQRILVFYGNEGDSDVRAPLILLSGQDGTRVGTQIDDLRTNVLQLLGRSLDGPAETLRPLGSHSHRVYYRGGGLHVRGRTVSDTDTHPITDGQWLEIESSVRPTGIEDADWIAFWSNIRPRVGPTWGDYVKFLNRFAEQFPAEQRDVRAMFAFVVTNEPNFRASSAFTGVLLNSTNNTPLPNLEIAFFSINSKGAVSVGGSAISDANGQFSVPYMPAGTFVCSIMNDSELEFDMNQDGKEDESAPVFVMQNELDLLNQTIYITEPAPEIVVTNDADATLVLDSQNVLHSFWFRNDLLWHSRNDNGNWVDAAPITTNRIDSFTVGKSAKLVDGSAPGLIVVWTQKETNRVDLHYSVGQPEGGSYTWSQPIQLTDDLVQNASPSVVVRESGLALVTYLKNGVGFRDDTDVYFSVIDFVSGNLLRNDLAPASFTRSLDLGTKQSFGWVKEFKLKPLGLKLDAAIEASGELTTAGCEAGASFKIEGGATIQNDDYSFNLKGTGEGSFGFNVDPDQCEWIYKEDSASANVGLTATFGAKNIVFKVLKAYPPTTVFSGALEEFVTGFGDYIGFELENTLELKISGALQGLHWDSPPAASFGIPKAAKAEIGVGGALKFGASYKNEIAVVDGTPLTDGLNFKGESSVELALKAQIYPKWDFLGGTLTPSFSVQVGSYKWAVPLPELVWADEDAPVAARSKRDAPTFTLDGVLTWDPASVFGTTNVYGTNSVVGNVSTDQLNDGSPALALDSDGNPYQIWYHDIDPFDERFGSELLMATFNGVDWTVPSAIPDTDGFNSQVSAATDANGNRMAIWVHADGSNVSTNMTFHEFFSERRAVDVHYAAFNGSTWSAPQPITVTDGADSDLQLSYLANGDVMAVWTYTETNSFKHLVSSRWNGTTWSDVEQIASGDIRTPAAQQSGGSIYLLWTSVDRGDDPESPAVSLHQSINNGSGWATPTLFAPEPGTSSPLVKPSRAFEFAQTRSLGGFVFGEIPKYCCKCKGQTTSVTNEPPTDCGVSFVKYDYETCQKIYEYKACSLVSFDPNDIVGPEGFGPERWVGVNPLNYVIRFENDALLATAPAKEVIITLPMDEDFDPRTFRLGNFGFGDISVDVPANQAFYSTRLDFTATKGFYVDFFAGVDVAKREAFWRLTTIDPATGTLPINPLLGFLPPNNTPPEGEGFVSFSLKANASTANGARVDAKATIVFDTQPPIDTPPIFNSIETGIPVSSVSPLPEMTHVPEFTVAWTGNDGVGGSGVAFYDIYASQNGGSYYLLAEATTLNSIPFVGEYGNAYAFYSVAHDNAGNIEDAPLVPDAEILIASSNTPPVLLNFTNAVVVEKTLFTRQVDGADADVPANALAFELLDAPLGMSITTNGLISWTPGESDGPGTNTIVVKLSDDGAPSLSATNSFTITILETNDAPVFLSSANYTVDEESTLTFTNDVIDLDIPTNSVTLELVSAPENVTFDSQSGVVTWTPGENDGGITNQIVVRATDNAAPPASTLRTNIIVVAEANAAPSLGTITNRTILPLSLVSIQFEGSDLDVPTNNLTFSLGAGSVGTVESETGLFRWKPGVEFGGTSNVITAIVTDDGIPSLSSTQHFAIVVEDFARIEIGSTALFVNQTGSVPITAISSAPWKTLQFTLQLPTNLLGNVMLEEVIDPTIAASLTYLDATHVQIGFSNAITQTPAGTNQLAQIGFKAIATNSAVLNLIPENQQIIGTNGESIAHLFDGPGRITIVGERPVLDAISLFGNQHSLLLFGNPGQIYTLETTTNLAEIISWDFFTNVTMTNVVQPVEGKANEGGQLFYRARQ